MFQNDLNKDDSGLADDANQNESRQEAQNTRLNLQMQKNTTLSIPEVRENREQSDRSSRRSSKRRELPSQRRESCSQIQSRELQRSPQLTVAEDSKRRREMNLKSTEAPPEDGGDGAQQE